MSLIIDSGKLQSTDNSITFDPPGGVGATVDLSFVGHIFSIASGKEFIISSDVQFDHLGRFDVNGRLVVNGRFVLGIGV